jgi:two-component system sensor histidine kinase HydH
LIAVTAVTLGIHYGWLIEPFFGHVHWIHAAHGRFCYIPIVMAAAWFGLRGGVWQAAVISLLVLPYIFSSQQTTHDLASEWVEIIFYFAIAVLVGLLVDREYAARRKQQESQVQLERSQKLSMAGQIAAGVAHEIKNPLASIRGAADILADESSSTSEREEFRDILQGEVRRIDGTVQEFLNFARPRQSRLERMNLSEALNTGVRQLEAQARKGSVTIRSDVAPGVEVRGDQEKLHQLVLNLLLNALQASPADTQIAVRLYTDAGHARLEISDQGTGIKPEHLEHVFEPFFTTQSSGTGLGLAISKTIVDDHHGVIQVYSEQSQGALVTVDLPLVQTGAVS